MGIALVLLILLIWILAGAAPRSDTLETVLNRADATDDEYLRQMGSEISSEVALKVRRIISDTNGWDVDENWPDMALVELLD